MSSAAPSIMSVFTDALTCQSPEERSAYLDRTCAGNPALREEVERLLEAHANAKGFLETTDAPAPQHEFSPGTTIDGRYKLLESIGEGGMGTVWVAEQLAPIRRKVAIKLVKPGMDSRQVLARFEAERQALALMDHPNIAKVYDGGVTEHARPYFVMEYVKGIPLTKYCDDARLPLQERLKLYVQVCQAVQHAHQKGIIHRDLKPSNILVCLYDGQPVPKVIDFGLAKAMHQPLTEHTLHTAHGFMIGTPLYMSPEQAEFNNLDVDTRTDIYSLGVILYELLTGSTPLEQQQFKKAALDEMLRLIKEVEPPKPSTRLSGSASLPSIAAQRGLDPAQLSKQVRGDLDWIVMKTLEKERSRRYETANGLARDVERFLHDEPVEACPPSQWYRWRKFAHKNRGTLRTAAVVLTLLLTGICVSTWQAIRATHAEMRAKELLISEGQQRKLAELSVETAVKSANSEREAKRRAEKREAEMQSVLDFVEKRVFLAASPSGLGEIGLGPDITLREALDNALRFVDVSFKDQPLVEVRVRSTIGVSQLIAGDLKSGQEQLEQALKLVDNQPDAKWLKAWVLHKFSFYHYLTSDLKQAVHFAEQATKLTVDAFGLEGSATDNAEWWLSWLYMQNNRPDQAAALVDKIVARRQRLLGVDHRSTLEAKGRLASICFLQRRFDESQALRKQVLGALKRTVGDDDPQTLEEAWTYAESSLTCELDGLPLVNSMSPAEALAALENVLAAKRRVVGEQDASTSKCIHSLSVWYRDFARPADSVRLAEELVEIDKKWIGPDHPDTLVSYVNLADSYLLAGRPADSLRVLDDVLPRIHDRFGMRHTFGARESYIKALRALGDTKRAESVAAGVLKDAADVLADRSDGVGLYSRGVFLARAGKWNEAIDCMKKAIALTPEVADYWYLVAYLHAVAGDKSGYRDHCTDMLKQFGDTDNSTLAERICKASLLMPDVDLDQSAIKRLADIVGAESEDHPYYRYFMSTHALAKYRSGDYQQAFESAQKCVFGPGEADMNPTTGWLLSAMALEKMNRSVEAGEAFKNAGKAYKGASFPRWGTTDLGNHWNNIVYIYLLKEECERLLKAGNVDSTVDGGGKKEEADVN